MKKDIQANSNPNKSRVAILILDKTGSSGIIGKKRQRSLYGDKGVNPSRRYNNYKYSSTNIRAHKYIKQKLTELKLL